MEHRAVTSSVRFACRRMFSRIYSRKHEAPCGYELCSLRLSKNVFENSIRGNMEHQCGNREALATNGTQECFREFFYLIPC